MPAWLARLGGRRPRVGCRGSGYSGKSPRDSTRASIVMRGPIFLSSSASIAGSLERRSRRDSRLLGAPVGGTARENAAITIAFPERRQGR
jgi:hypothetical protein